MSAKIIIAGLAFLAAASGVARADSLAVVAPEVDADDTQLTYGGCKSTTEQVGPCSVHFSVCYGFYKRKWRYTATACASGICGQSGHTKSGKGAAEEAAKDLFAKGPACLIPSAVSSDSAPAVVLSVPTVVLQEPAESYDPLETGGCKSSTEQIGPCSVQFSVCYGFYKRKWTYTATACASGICGQSGHTKSGQGAAEEAAKDLFAKGPACLIPSLKEDKAEKKSESEEGFTLSDAEAVAVEKFIQSSPEAALTGSCKTVHEQIGACSVSFKVCGKISKFKWKYDCTACASGKCVSSGGHKSGKGAAEEAAKKLFTAPFPACAIPAQLESPVAVAEDKAVAVPPPMKKASASLSELDFPNFGAVDIDDAEEADESEDADEPSLAGLTCKKVNKQVGNCNISFKVCGKIRKFKWRYTATACASGKCASSSAHKSAKGAAEDAAKKLFVAPYPACAIPSA